MNSIRWIRQESVAEKSVTEDYLLMQTIWENTPKKFKKDLLVQKHFADFAELEPLNTAEEEEDEEGHGGCGGNCGGHCQH
ncbi:MAG: hypothetical protein HQM12_21460 [SAR324 cluster bacterium]|nr:hypothetical protein [SAR324 cluster bacterium]MBF0350620.1 hypothetical protein [SAR324 cluster bacterium]